jgi:hypothetical protein
MTGAYVRIYREGSWQAVEFDQLTDSEMNEFADRLPDDGWKWAKFLAQWIRDQVKEEEQ